MFVCCDNLFILLFRPTDYTRGIFQSIGFKEFHEYLILSEEERSTESGQKKFIESLDNLKLATRRYARRQNKTIKNRFLGHPSRQVIVFIVIHLLQQCYLVGAIQNAYDHQKQKKITNEIKVLTLTTELYLTLGRHPSITPY